MIRTKSMFLNVLKGVFIGIGTIIPGVSGGTAAIIAGVFEDILDSAANIFKHLKKSLLFLTPILLGVLLGILAVSKPIELFCSNFPIISKYIFCVLSLISTILFIRKSLTLDINLGKALSLLCGVLSAISVTVVTKLFEFNISNAGNLSLLFTGILLSLALVLPAISFSYMLLFFGIYEKTLSAISELDFIFLFPLGLGVICGSLIFSKLFLKLVQKRSQESYAFILGFVLCSIVDILL